MPEGLTVGEASSKCAAEDNLFSSVGGTLSYFACRSERRCKKLVHTGRLDGFEVCGP
jgi:hypothetical protein